MPTFTLLLPHDYVANATKRIKAAKKRIVLLSMIVAQGPDTDGLVDAILDAARRGVDVQVAADIFTYGELNGTFLRNVYYTKNARGVTNMGKLLKEAGVKFQWLGRSQVLIFSGRTHSKWCVVDDTVYIFGGVNMYQKGVNNIDYMFRTVSKELADRIVYEYTTLARADKTGRLYKSHQFDIGKNHVLVDCGIVGNSIIYRHARDLANSASSIVYVSQYPPACSLARRLKARKSVIYFNEPKHADFLSGLLIGFTRWTTGVHSSYKKSTYLHAKFMIFYMHDGSRVAITGSHNFSNMGVMMGTREIALETRDPKIIDQLEHFLKTEIN